MGVPFAAPSLDGLAEKLNPKFARHTELTRVGRRALLMGMRRTLSAALDMERAGSLRAGLAVALLFVLSAWPLFHERLHGAQGAARTNTAISAPFSAVNAFQ